MSSTLSIPFSLKLGEGLALGIGISITAFFVSIRLWTKLKIVGAMLPEDCECLER